ncbi:MAG: hypothetical protein C0503_06695 [Gemmatimonas sp.]|nr:hypothetical protein [Gemmatimonas sp.]
MTKRRGIQLLPTRRTGDARVSLTALVLQIVLLAIVVPSFLVPVAYDWLRDDSGRPIMPEEIRFEVVLLTGGEPNREAPRDGGDGRPIDDTQPAEPLVVPPLVAPGAVPTGIPTAPAVEEPSSGGGYGDIIGDGGPIRGLRPTFTDQRLWVKPGNVVVAPIVPLTRADTLRLMLERSIQAYADAAGDENQGRRPGDWTFNLGGKKWGVDQGMIRLGNFSLPTPVLAMLPLNNVQANPIAAERARRLDAMRSEIVQQAARQMRDDEFDQAVKALRERREKERQATRAAQDAQRNPPQPVDPTRP